MSTSYVLLLELRCFRRYAYTNGMDDGVIKRTKYRHAAQSENMADRLAQDGGWATSAFGKWDCGMTTWGSTPTCRASAHITAYGATSDYTHMVDTGFDYHENESRRCRSG